MATPDDTHVVDRLFSAVREGQHDVVKTMLPESGWDVNQRHRSGATLLMMACMSGVVEALAVVLVYGSQHGINVDGVNHEGCTALTCAADQGYREMCELLIAYGAKVNHLSRKGATPLMHACCRGHLRVVRLLLECGGNPNTPSTDQWTPLLHAANGGHARIVSALLDAGAAVDAATDAGITAMMRAAGRGRLECVKLLLAAGANVNKRGGNGCSPLIFAAANGHVEVCMTLVECGANPTLRDANGLTAVDAAVKHGEEGAEAFLRSVDNAPHIRRSNTVSFVDLKQSVRASRSSNGLSAHNDLHDSSQHSPLSDIPPADSQVRSYPKHDMMSKAETRPTLRYSASQSNSPNTPRSSHQQSPSSRHRPHSGAGGGVGADGWGSDGNERRKAATKGMTGKDSWGSDGNERRKAATKGMKGKKQLLEITDELPPQKSDSFFGELLRCCTGSGGPLMTKPTELKN